MITHEEVEEEPDLFLKTATESSLALNTQTWNGHGHEDEDKDKASGTGIAWRLGNSRLIISGFQWIIALLIFHEKWFHIFYLDSYQYEMNAEYQESYTFRQP